VKSTSGHATEGRGRCVVAPSPRPTGEGRKWRPKTGLHLERQLDGDDHAVHEAVGAEELGAEVAERRLGFGRAIAVVWIVLSEGLVALGGARAWLPGQLWGRGCGLAEAARASTSAYVSFHRIRIVSAFILRWKGMSASATALKSTSTSVAPSLFASTSTDAASPAPSPTLLRQSLMKCITSGSSWQVTSMLSSTISTTITQEGGRATAKGMSLHAHACMDPHGWGPHVACASGAARAYVHCWTCVEPATCDAPGTIADSRVDRRHKTILSTVPPACPSASG